MDIVVSREVSVPRSNHSMYWTYEKEVLLIKYFEQHRYLWDTDHVLFHKRLPRLQAFEELVQLLGIDEATVRQRWSSMRSQFCREERKVASCISYIPTWDHYHSLLFLKKPNEEVSQEPCEMIEQEESVFREDHFEGPTILRVTSLPDETDGHQEHHAPANTSHTVMSANMEGYEKQTINSPQSEEPVPLNLDNRQEFKTFFNKSTSRRDARLNHRLNPKYAKKYKAQTTSKVHSASSLNTAPERPKQLTENECFSQYICKVLDRFSEERQRKCRNELLRIILNFDIGEEGKVQPKAS